MEKYYALVLKYIMATVLAVTSGCIIVDTEAPVLTQAICNDQLGVAVDGFVSSTIDVNPVYGTVGR